MNHGFPLLPGERVLWAGLRGQPARLPGGAVGCRVVYGWGLIFFFAGTAGIPLLVLPETRLYALAVLVTVVGTFLLYRRLGKRPVFFVTDQRILERTLFGASGVPLAEIAAYRRQIDRYQYRGSTEEVVTNTLLLRSHSGLQRSLGPLLDYDEVASFLDGVIARAVDPSKMRALDGRPSAAEQREDIFVAVTNHSNGELYGPLVIGPRGLVRFTSKLPMGLEGQLLTVLAQPVPAESLEERTLFLARRPDAGHAWVLDLSAAELGLDGTTLRVTTKERTEPIQLDGEGAMRCRKFLQARRAAGSA